MSASAVHNGATLLWGRLPYAHPGLYLNSGNRCGHNPAQGEFERYTAPETRRPLPHIMQAFIEGAREYYRRPSLLPTLANLSGRSNADGNARCNRSEARAAESLVLSAIIQHTEFASLRVGTPRPDGSFINRSCGELAQIAGLLDAKRSVPGYPQPSQRFWRAFRRLKRAGAFTVHTQYETRPDGSKRARPAIKHLSADFLLCLGKVGYQKLKTFRDKCYNQLKKLRKLHREQNPEATDAEKARQRVAMAGTGPARMHKQRRGARDIPDVNDDYEAQRRYNIEQIAWMAKVQADNPGASNAEILQLVRIKYPPYKDWLAAQQRQ